MNKQVYASVIAVAIVLVHIFLLFYLWIVFRERFPEPAVAEIATPLTGAFFIGVVKWVIDTQGKITSGETVGIVFVIITSIVVIALLGGLVALPLAYEGGRMTAAQLNSYFLFLDTGLGAAFTLLFNDMFGKPGVQRQDVDVVGG
jgi:hypothetical protein